RTRPLQAQRPRPGDLGITAVAGLVSRRGPAQPPADSDVVHIGSARGEHTHRRDNHREPGPGPYAAADTHLLVSSVVLSPRPCVRLTEGYRPGPGSTKVGCSAVGATRYRQEQAAPAGNSLRNHGGRRRSVPRDSGETS